MFKKLRLSGQRGFTLIELLVVVAILGILAAVAVPNIASMMNAGDLSAAKGEAASVQTAADAYYTDKGKPAPDTAALIAGQYFRTTTLKGTYTIAQSGAIIGTIKGVDGTYGTTGFTWDTGNNTWKK